MNVYLIKMLISKKQYFLEKEILFKYYIYANNAQQCGENVIIIIICIFLSINIFFYFFIIITKLKI
jgi:hypothetical protein